MSEEILKALMQLFAIIAKQDEGVETNEIEYVKIFLTQQLNDEAVNEYFTLFEKHAGLNEEDSDDSKSKKKLTSVKDSVRILGLCKKINKTLTQNQKIVVLVRLFELVNADRKFSDQRMAIINTVAEVFKVSQEEFKSIENFVVKNDLNDQLEDPNVMIINDSEIACEQCKHIQTEKLDEAIFILRIPSVDLYFLKYTGNEALYLNGLALNNKRIYLFANGSTVKLPKGKPIYYSDVVAHFLADINGSKIEYQVEDIEFRFLNGNVGLRNISFSENHGKLIGIMGASGAGKTTLLNVLSGIDHPSQGSVSINGIDLHKEKDKLEGVIGLIPQDDLLIEELTVFENLYYNAKLCFKDKAEEELVTLVNKTLSNLGLLDRKDLKVGSPLNKTISGGQRKRLNIALELVREPSILFVDEPTSGLSSRDSENVMDLLRELTLKGKLIFVVIHQPSSEIYKMFDKMVILDTGGYMIYYGNPVEAVMYFKKLDLQINSDVGECPTCGNVNPELIFNIIEARVVDEFGNYTESRKVSPTKWEEHYKAHEKPEPAETVKERPPKGLNIPNWFNQLKIYTLRDFFSKISNKQYIALNLLEAPILGFILSYIIRYIADPKSNIYIFRENENIHIYIFMALIVALFLGLTVSAEEIFRDRKILKREAFLNLSRSSYLTSKIIILFTISAIQAFLFLVIANNILGIKDMMFQYWFALFSTAAFANMLGLNVSASFNSAVTIYILIPLLMIPMMILSGAMFSFEKLNKNVTSIDKVPFIAEFMVTKWAYEALMVHQFKNNNFKKNTFSVEMHESIGDFKTVHLIPALYDKLDEVEAELENNGKIEETADNLTLLRLEIEKELRENPKNSSFENLENITPDKCTEGTCEQIRTFLDKMNTYYEKLFMMAIEKKEKMINTWLEMDADKYHRIRNDYHNEGVADMVLKVYEKNKIIEVDNEFIQQFHPIFNDPNVKGYLDFRSHFYAPRKHFMGKYFDTYWFNMLFIWLLTSFLYVTLYYEALKKLLNMFEGLKFKK
jgi:ABC-type multidrug transport system ATPase subunit